MKNERTGKKVAAIAGKVLRRMERTGNTVTDSSAVFIDEPNDFCVLVCTVAELKALAASALTQAPDKKRA